MIVITYQDDKSQIINQQEIPVKTISEADSERVRKFVSAVLKDKEISARDKKNFIKELNQIKESGGVFKPWQSPTFMRLLMENIFSGMVGTAAGKVVGCVRPTLEKTDQAIRGLFSVLSGSSDFHFFQGTLEDTTQFLQGIGLSYQNQNVYSLNDLGQLVLTTCPGIASAPVLADWLVARPSSKPALIAALYDQHLTNYGQSSTWIATKVMATNAAIILIPTVTSLITAKLTALEEGPEQSQLLAVAIPKNHKD